ncbi:helix-turn-helix domain-containing protein [Puniceibacterium sp. IMCC21224]|uniref:helix-turn-helix domain-containing protein n=1 Tax=Puniceibacterium sp. IMCC21224 TaxID=1618204 RepID=UPI00064DD073|nr:helix-turn-helix domain-containing protein [Puniceibacterium sp. IMCC21224]KMK68933.1 Helix-turn-helix protein [Puniceibacterium sp. IMCC21224]
MNDTSDQDTWYGPDSATFGDRLAAARDAAGMTQEELAKRLGIKPKSLQSWEEDLAEPRANRLSMMAGLLNVSMMWLMNGEGEGLSAPPEDPPEVDLRAVLTEIRGMQVELHASAERLGRLEKKLRKVLRDQNR